MMTRQRDAMWAAAVVAAAAAGCGDGAPYAYGNFEATEVAVSAELSGTLLRFDIDEGQALAAGAVAGQIDTVPLGLQRGELLAQREALQLAAAEAEAQIGVLDAQLATAREDSGRTARLYAAGAATAQALSRAQGEVAVLKERTAAARAGVRRARQEERTIEARVAQVEERLAKSRITNPIDGTVLTTYVEAGEFVQPGRPLYTIARLDTLTLRAWVSGAQLAGLRLGDEVRVRVDAGRDSLHVLRGRITWIASEAEFTPTPIQTRDERVDLVYAVKVRVANPDGIAKVGMPGELVREGA